MRYRSVASLLVTAWGVASCAQAAPEDHVVGEWVEVRGEPLETVRRPFVKPNVITWESINELWGVQEI